MRIVEVEEREIGWSALLCAHTSWGVEEGLKTSLHRGEARLGRLKAVLKRLQKTKHKMRGALDRLERSRVLELRAPLRR